MRRRLCALLATALVLVSGCNDNQKPDPFGGCSVHPGECGRTK